MWRRHRDSRSNVRDCIEEFFDTQGDLTPQADATQGLPTKQLRIDNERLNIVARIEPAPPPDVDHNLANAQPLSNVPSVQATPFNLDGTG